MDWQPPDKPVVNLKNSSVDQMSKNERIKAASQGLFHVSDGKKDPHTFIDEVDALSAGEQTALSGEGKELSKFSGVYGQQARTDTGKKTGDNSFMVRIKCPGGGELSAEQWAALDDATDQFGDGTLRLTSRQTIQYHHVYGPKLAPLMRHLNKNYRKDGTLSACGDVNRNVMCSPIDGLDPAHQPRAKELAEEIATALSPNTSAYYQIWVSDEEGRRSGPVTSDEPLYGELYLPRKFKIGIGHATDNNPDALTHDVGLFPVINGDAADGSVWDFYTGGGMGLTQNNAHTASLLGLYLGRLRREDVISAIRAVVTIQNEEGERKDRKQARWKYTMRRLGVENVKRTLRERFGIKLEDAEPQAVPPMRPYLGWHDQADGQSFYGLSIPSGRLKDGARKAVRKAVEELGLGVRLTGQQNLLLCNVSDRAAVDEILDQFEVSRSEDHSMVQKNSLACPALPTCPLAMTGAETVLPEYFAAIEAEGLGEVDVAIRMTGCPNNCVRPAAAEIGIYGFGKNAHTITVGGTREGTRIGKILYPKLSGEQMVPALVGLVRAIRDQNPGGLAAGEFLHQADPEQLRSWVGVE